VGETSFRTGRPSASVKSPAGHRPGMQYSRRAWGVAGLAAALAGLAVVVAQPLVLGGAITAGAWLLARAWRFASGAAQTHDAATVAVAPAREQVTAGEDLAVTVSVDLDAPAAVEMRATVQLPVGAEAVPAGDRTALVPAGDTEASTTFVTTLPVAGQQAFRPTDITYADDLFETAVDTDTDATVTTAPRSTGRIHVGEGGDQVAAFGAHDTGDTGPGIEPATVRRYVPGDPTADIDWKVTARLREPHVREFELATDRRTALVVDHRASTAAGPPGRRKLDLLRAVALSYLAGVAREGEAVGLYAVGDDGLTERLPPDTGADHYERVRRALVGLEPTDGTGPDRAAASGRRATAALADDDTPFGATLRPLYAGATPEQVVADRPLYATVRSEIGRLRGPTVTVLFTDDTHRAEVRDAVGAATRGGDHALAVVAPGVLFERDGLADLDRAYERYVAFEDERRSLAGRPRTAAYEVGPGDRMDAILAARRAES